MGHELRVLLQIHPGQLTRRNSTLPQNCFFLALRVGMLEGGGRERGEWRCSCGWQLHPGMCNLTLLEQMGVSWPWTIHSCLLWVLLWVFSFIIVVVEEAPGTALNGYRTCFSRLVCVWAQKIDTGRAGKRKDKLNSFSGSGTQK